MLCIPIPVSLFLFLSLSLPSKLLVYLPPTVVDQIDQALMGIEQSVEVATRVSTNQYYELQCIVVLQYYNQRNH